MNAETRVYEKMNNTLYKRVGRKYIQVNDPYAYEGLREGWWLVKVASGCTTIRQQVFPNKSEITAAARDKEDQLIDIICKASEARLFNKPISEQAKKDWEWFISRNGSEFNTLEYPSIQENAQMIIEKILEK
jgi:hypothetical protein